MRKQRLITTIASLLLLTACSSPMREVTEQPTNQNVEIVTKEVKQDVTDVSYWLGDWKRNDGGHYVTYSTDKPTTDQTIQLTNITEREIDGETYHVGRIKGLRPTKVQIGDDWLDGDLEEYEADVLLLQATEDIPFTEDIELELQNKLGDDYYTIIDRVKSANYERIIDADYMNKLALLLLETDGRRADVLATIQKEFFAGLIYTRNNR